MVAQGLGSLPLTWKTWLNLVVGGTGGLNQRMEDMSVSLPFKYKMKNFK